LVILKTALDKMNNLGCPMFQKTDLYYAAINRRKPTSSYPKREEMQALLSYSYLRELERLRLWAREELDSDDASSSARLTSPNRESSPNQESSHSQNSSASRNSSPNKDPSHSQRLSRTPVTSKRLSPFITDQDVNRHVEAGRAVSEEDIFMLDYADDDNELPQRKKSLGPMK